LQSATRGSSNWDLRGGGGISDFALAPSNCEERDGTQNQDDTKHSPERLQRLLEAHNAERSEGRAARGREKWLAERHSAPEVNPMKDGENVQTESLSPEGKEKERLRVI